MLKYSKNEIIAIARTNNFITNTYEKVLRLCDVLKYINDSKYGEMLALKGGTAINLWVLNMPRLSVDADFDFTLSLPKEEMFLIRNEFKKDLSKYMEFEGYSFNSRSKFTHTLDSFVYGYKTLSGANDVLKIEINYSNRVHLLNTFKSDMTIDISDNIRINRLSNEELIGSKINALIIRTTPRDVYDVYNILKGIELNIQFVKKISIYYIVLGSDIPIDLNVLVKNAIFKMKLMNYNLLRETLIPVLHKGEKINIEEITKTVIEFIERIFILDDNELKYINDFNNGIYDYKTLFNDYNVNDVSMHPMAMWKIKNINNSK